MTNRRRWEPLPGLAASVGALVWLLACDSMDAADPSTGPASPAAETPYKLADGPCEVQQARNLSLRDSKRDKDLAVTITYPKGDGPFPVIVFSHGAGGAGDGRMPLIRFWATHGYIILAPTHADSLAHRKERTGEGMRGVIRKLMTDGPGWENRSRDVSFVIDSLSDIEAKVPALKGRMDATRLGVGGHSYGAYTSQLIAGATVDIPGGEKARSFADDRPRAILLLSPQSRGQMGLAEGSWAKITRPMMAVTGTRDFGALGKGPEAKLDPFKFAPPGDKYAVLIKDAYHMSFLGRAADLDFGAGLLTLFSSPGIEQTDQAAVFDYVKIATIAFWDAYLKQDAKAKECLQSDALPTYSKGAVRLDRK